MTVRTYYCWRDNSLWTVRTDRPIPQMWKQHGLVCKKCNITFPEHGDVSDVLAGGCTHCGRTADLANVYEYVEGGLTRGPCE